MCDATEPDAQKQDEEIDDSNPEYSMSLLNDSRFAADCGLLIVPPAVGWESLGDVKEIT